MRKRTKSCFECKEVDDVLYRCRYGGERTWVFLCENYLSLVKTTLSRLPILWHWKAKRNN